jgi:hypothetical protein
MHPVLRAGDLALVRSERHYAVGDVVAYRSAIVRTTVLHRIVGGSERGYVTRGDNNSFTDPDHPTDAQIVGRMWIHVPAGGRIIHLVMAPLFAIAAAALWFTMGRQPSRHLTRRPRMRLPSRDTAVAASVIAAVLAVGTFALPAHAMSAHDIAVRQTAVFKYHAATSPSPVYPEGRIETGDPLFLRVASAVDVEVAYEAGEVVRRLGLEATGSLAARFATSDGIERVVALEPQHRLSDGAPLRGHLDAGALVAQLQAIRAATGTPGTDGSLVVTASIDLTGKVDGRQVDLHFQPSMAFTLDTLRLLPVDAATRRTGEHREAATAHVSARAQEPTHLRAFRTSVSVGTARVAATAALLLALAGLFLAHRQSRYRPTPQVGGDPTE